MYPYMNEEIAWRRLQDAQREAENRRLLAGGGPLQLGLGRLVGDLAWAMARSIRPRWWSRPAKPRFEERESARDVA